jgi:general transcriptional corepressor TUP1
MSITRMVSMAISPNDALVLAGMLDGTVCMWNVSTGQLLERFRGHYIYVSAVVFTRDGCGFVTGSWDNTIKYWEIDFSVVHEMEDEPRSAKATREGKNCAKCTHTMKGHESIIHEVSVSPDGQWITSAGFDGSIIFWDRNGAPRLMMNQDTEFCRFDLLCL